MGTKMLKEQYNTDRQYLQKGNIYSKIKHLHDHLSTLFAISEVIQSGTNILLVKRKHLQRNKTPK